MRRHTLFMKRGLIIFCLLATTFSFSQDMHFSQFNQAPMQINPAQAGATAWMRGILIYRTQWSSVPVPYTTLGASFDIKMKKRWQKVNSKKRPLLFKSASEKGLGWGVTLYNDRAGDGKMGTLLANFSIAYQLKISTGGMLSGGLQAGLIQKSINYNNLYWENQYSLSSSTGFDKGINAMENFSNNKFISPDFSAGILYAYRKNERYMRGNDQRDIQVGASIMHINRPKYSLFKNNETIYTRIMLHGNGIMGIKNSNFSLAPGFLFSKQGPNQEFLFGALIRYMLKEDSRYTGYVKGSTIALGGYYRNKDSFILAGAIEMSSYSIGLSYDINISQLKAASYGRGGFEITLRFLNPSPFLFSKASFS